MEAPEPWFFDITTVRVVPGKNIVEIDPIFREVCEIGSIRVTGAIASPGTISVEMRDGDIVVTSLTETVVTLTVAGIRRGFAGRRFALRTEEEFHKNNDFWTLKK
jgi:hypothetical protein